MIYLDHAATTPVSDKALEVFVNVSKHYFGNSHSLHDEGSAAEQILDASKKTLANTLSASPRHIYFTSGATEANFLAIYSLLAGLQKQTGHLITTPVEHSSVRNLFLKLEREGYEVSTVSVNAQGEVDVEHLESLIQENTVLASIQHVNSEIGTVQNLQKIGSLLHAKGVLLHSDCVQSFGRIPLDVSDLPVDAISISSHKIYGPKGAGAVWMNPKTKWKPVFPDVEHKVTFKPGTKDVPSIAAFATAAKHITQNMEAEQQRIAAFRTKLIEQLKELPFEFEIEGHPQNNVPNILGLRFAGIEGQFFMLECNQAGLAISTGSACRAGSDHPSKTMMATGKSEQDSRQFIRLSFGKSNTEDQIPLIIEKMNSILTRHFNKVNYHRHKEGIIS